MNKQQEWKIAKLVKKRRCVTRSDLPTWARDVAKSQHGWFHVCYSYFDKDGYPSPDQSDEIKMSDKNLDAYIEERRKRIHEFRDWLEPVGVITASIIALASLAVSIIALCN